MRFGFPVPGVVPVSGVVFLSCERHYRREEPVRNGIIVLSPIGKFRPEKVGCGNAAGKRSPGAVSIQERMLKMKLKLRWRTAAAGKHLPQMFHGLQQRIRVRAGGR